VIRCDAFEILRGRVRELRAIAGSLPNSIGAERRLRKAREETPETQALEAAEWKGMKWKFEVVN
jgi:hypothetical protein